MKEEKGRVVWRDRVRRDAAHGWRPRYVPEVYAIGLVVAAAWINAAFHLG
ncbi:MAG TPA: hypothetical protein VJM34_18055 [Novosphingobium sp.]|nr:hypothetical protein [Novosphingobium sp.]